MSNRVAFAVLCFAVTGLFLSLVMHVAALLGMGHLGGASWVLLECTSLMGLPVGIAIHRMSMGMDLYHLLKALFAGCPRWMCWAGPALFYYGVLVAALVGLMTRQAQVTMNRDPTDAQVLSAFCISFYAASATFAFSAWNFNRRCGRRCPNQHAVGPVTTSCGQCGARIADS